MAQNISTSAPSQNRAIGSRGEAIAAAYLQSIGCDVLDRNWRFGRNGELDLVIRDGDTVAAVEVKTRSGRGYGSPFEAITSRKAARLRMLLLSWVQQHRPGVGKLRIDAVAVLLLPAAAPRITHLRGIE